MSENFFIRSLSGKLLLITFAFVMVAEALIFIPSAAMFRQNWLEERAQAAGLLTLAIEGVPNFEGGDMLSHRFMQDTGVTMIRQKRMGRNHLVLGVPPVGTKIIIDDLRHKRRLPLFRKTFRDFFSDGQASIRILAAPTVADAELLEIIVPQSALKSALIDYSKRVLLWSLALSALTGLFIYMALNRLIVRPLGRLAKALKHFRADPRKRTGDIIASKRADEIGQLEREFVDMKSGVRHAFVQQERLATLGMAMAKINHDLRNVLTSAGLISDRLTMEKDARIKAMGERLVRAVERGIKLCAATLSFSQSVEEKPEARPLRIATLIGEAAGDVMSEEGHVQFKNQVDHKINVMADPEMTYRIFHNLFRNAVQAMQNISPAKHSANTPANTPAKPPATLTVSSEIMDDKICIFVRDSGTGIPKPALENLFKAFTSAGREGGTGLGLTISRELARAQNGNLKLESSDENGTVFALTLPLAGTNT